MQDLQSVKIYKALADPTRLKMVRDLATCPTGKKSCGDLSAKAPLSQPALSHHFSKLVEAGIVTERKNGTHKNYQLNHKLLEQAGININKL